MSNVWRLVCVAALLLAGSALADDAGQGEAVALPGKGAHNRIQDPVIRDMLALDAIAPFEDLAPLWGWRDTGLQSEVDKALESLDLDDDVRRNRLAVALVDVTNPDRPRVAEVNGDTMMYAASLPKIAVLLAAFEKIAQGKMKYDKETRNLLELMIRRSNNRYRLYDPAHNGGLWVGKDYAKTGLWKRDPIHNLSHGATAIQVARFYYLLHTEQLVTPEWSREMKDVMSGHHINHKFVRALRAVTPRMNLHRKSGSWRTYHSDSALVEHDGRTYIAVALSNDPNGSKWMQRIIVALDRIVVAKN
jgi:beta-lactamase class A